MNIRYRLRVWLPDKPDQVAQKYLSLKCKLCAASRAMDMATMMERNMGRSPGAALWEVQQIMGHLNTWQVIQQSRTARTEWIKRHGH